MPYDKVCFLDGWHHAVMQDEDGHDVPGEKLFLAEDGNYRPYEDGDESWFDRKHQRYSTIEMEDGTSTRVTAEEFAEIQKLLAERRGG